MYSLPRPRAWPKAGQIIAVHPDGRVVMETHFTAGRRVVLLWREATPERMTQECRDLGVSAALSWLWTQQWIAMRARPWALDPEDTVLDGIVHRARMAAGLRWTGKLWAIGGRRYRTRRLALDSVWR